MKLRLYSVLGWSVLGAALGASFANGAERPPASETAAAKTSAVAQPAESPRVLHDAEQQTHGSAVIGGHPLSYVAEAGVMVVHVKDPMDDDPPRRRAITKPPPPQPPEAACRTSRISGRPEDPHRPITFLYNGGPGSSTVWLHMGAFGPKRVVTADDTHSPAAPYRVVDNEYSLLDASDLVFIDAPGTGFGHLRGKDKDKAFYGVDQDAHAFAEFHRRVPVAAQPLEFAEVPVRRELRHDAFGGAASTSCETEKSLDLNGVILLSQILNFDDSVDAPQFNPGVDLPYELALPTYAATAWYHHKLAESRRPQLDALVDRGRAVRDGRLCAGARRRHRR